MPSKSSADKKHIVDKAPGYSADKKHIVDKAPGYSADKKHIVDKAPGYSGTSWTKAFQFSIIKSGLQSCTSEVDKDHNFFSLIILFLLYQLCDSVTCNLCFFVI